MLSFVALAVVSFTNNFQLYEDAQWRQRALESYREQTALQNQANQEDFQEIQQKQRDEKFDATILAEEAEIQAQIADLENFQQKRIADDKAEAKTFVRREENLQRYQRDSYLAASHEAEFPENAKNFGTVSRARKFKANAKKDESAFRNAKAEKRSQKYAQKAIEAKPIEESKAENQPIASILKQEDKEQAHKDKWAQRAENSRMKREEEKLLKWLKNRAQIAQAELEAEREMFRENIQEEIQEEEHEMFEEEILEVASSNSSTALPQSSPDSDSDETKVVKKSAPTKRSVLRGFGNFASWICSGKTCRA